ncbi:MAG: alpha/beta hydrolase [Rubripirellula sp.]
MLAVSHVSFRSATIATIAGMILISQLAVANEGVNIASELALEVPTHVAAPSCPDADDRQWCISTRRISSDVCRINLEQPAFSVSRLNQCGSGVTTFDDYASTLNDGSQVVIYVHGYRMDAKDVVGRGMSVYRSTRACRSSRPIDWVIWSWPSNKEGRIIRDVRSKADRTDAQGLYLAWVLRELAERSVPTTLIGYSFGGRVITGALHALAGGGLKGRRLPGAAVTGLRIDAGLVAPAVESNWMTRHGYHGKATQNLDRLLVLYNKRDAILKRYWLIDRVRGSMALGYSGPRAFAPRSDGSKLSVTSRDCSVVVGKHHVELEYYTSSCRAGSEMAKLINDIEIQH